MKDQTNILDRAKKQIDLAAFTTFGLAGRADLLFETAKPAELIEAVKEAKKRHLPYFVMAGGSNIVPGGKNYPGLVIVYRSAVHGTQILNGKGSSEQIEISVPASAYLEEVVPFTLEHGLAGLESLSGIPGTVGGAIYGNAGAYGHSISEAVSRVLIFDGRKDRWLTAKDCGFSYRESIFKQNKWLILEVRLKLTKGKREDLLAYYQKLLKLRGEKYSGIKCPGSFFKNVLVSTVSKKALGSVDQTKIIDGKIPAGYLLAEVGAKGMRIGGLRIADYHGNLIINDGSGTPRDVKKLVKILKAKVKDKFGIKLEEEIRYLI